MADPEVRAAASWQRFHHTKRRSVRKQEAGRRRSVATPAVGWKERVSTRRGMRVDAASSPDTVREDCQVACRNGGKVQLSI